MKIFLLLFATVTIASAQTFSFHVEDTVLFASPTIADVIASGVFTNTGAVPLNLVAHRAVNVSDTNWNTAVCMAICMGPGIDTAGAYNIPPGGTQLFLLHFTPSTTPTSGEVKMEFYDPAAPSVVLSQWFHLSTNGQTQFTNPANGSSLFMGEEDTIQWTSPLTASAQLSYSTDAGEDWIEISSAVPLNGGAYVWTPGLQFINNAKLRLRVGSESIISDLLKVTARFFEPLGGTKLRSGMPDTVRWTPGVGGSAEFDYSVNNGSWTKVTSGVNMTSGKYVWIPNANINSTNVRVRLKTSEWIFTSDPFAVGPLSGVSESGPTTFRFSATPNPAIDRVTFSSAGEQLQSVEVLNLLGTVVLHASQANGSTLSLDVSRLPSGMYRAMVLGRSATGSIPLLVAH